MAIVGTIFATAFQNDLVPQLTAAGVPDQIIRASRQGGGALDTGNLTAVGDMGAAILAAIPAQFVPVVQPYITNIVEGIHGAFSLAVGQTFCLGVFGAIVAVIAALAMKELPLRASNSATRGDGRAWRSGRSGDHDDQG